MTTNSPSPSPPPTAPIPQQPGPRALQLRKLHATTLNATLKAISLSSFLACFPTLSTTAPEQLKYMHGDLLGKLETFARGEFEDIIVERKVVEGLNGLEAVIEGGKRRREEGKARGEDGEMKIAPHTLPPQLLMRAHLSPIHTQQQNHLNAKMQTVASTNAQLASEITQQREEIERLVSLVEVLVKDLEGAVEGMEGVENGNGVEALSARAREVEEVILRGS